MAHVELVETDDHQCVGCGICELVCSFYHEGVCAPSLSGIRLRRQEQKWYDFEVLSPYSMGICRQCPSPSPCEEECPVENVLTREDKLGVILINSSLCINCGKCVEACPYDGVWYNKAAEKIVRCDLCGGDPECVKWCPPQVLKYVTDTGGNET